MEDSLRTQLKENLRSSILKYVTNFKYGSISPLDLLIPKERKIRSVVGGLETSMGTTVWEPIAKTFAVIGGFEIIEGKILKPDPFPEALANELSVVMALRENRSTWIPAIECVKRFKAVCKNIDRDSLNFVPPAPGTGADIRIKKDNQEFAYDSKTVQPNLGGIKGFNKEILEWYAYRICKDPDVDIQCKIAYPYNPYKSEFWLHTPHNSGVLEPGVDAVVENEFWDFLSGFTGTYQKIVDILSELNSEGFGQEISRIIEQMHSPTQPQ